MSRKRGGVALLLLGLVIASSAALVVYRQARQAADTALMESVEVVVAAQDIPERTMMAAPFLSVKRMLPTSLPPTALVRPEDVVGKMTTGPIHAGEFILPAKLVDSDGRTGLTYQVPKGKVVITMPASDILTTGAVRPGDHVDLLVTIEPEEDRQSARAASPTPAAGQNAAPAPTATATADVEQGTTQTTMQNLRVIAIGSVAAASTASDEGKTGAPAPAASVAAAPTSLITFAIEPQDALVLKALKDSERIKLELVLRAAGDEELFKTDPVTLQTIVDRYQFRAVPTPRAATP